MTNVIYFEWLDYLVFGAMLVVSALIGVYFAFFASKKQNTTSEYLMGGKTMGIFPISMSLIASYVSGISLLGLPAEMYTYGTQLWTVVLSEWAVSLTIAIVYLPVFYNLQITSTYEYLWLRFDQKVRLLGSVIFIIKMLLYIPIVVYVPALAFSQVTGINLHLVTPIVCVVCIFYTTLNLEFLSNYKQNARPPTPEVFSQSYGDGRYLITEWRTLVHRMAYVTAGLLPTDIISAYYLAKVSPILSLRGGLKAVVWTDTLQTILMYFGVLFVLIYGTLRLGGFQNVIDINEKGDRLEFFNMDMDPTIRHTFWSTVFGNYFSWLASCSVNQAMVQRCLALSSLKRARITIYIMAVGIFTIVSLCCYTGLVIYATFSECDPLTTGAIRKSDQLLPYFVMTITGSIPALPGIFMSGVFSAALSSMSTGLNSMCGVIFEDLIRPVIKKPISEKTASLIMKIIVVVIGVACVALVFLVERMGAMIQAGKSLAGITAGSLLGLFSMGLFLPWVNATGALIGGIASTLLVGWISLGTQAAMIRGDIVIVPKSVSVAGCTPNITLSITPNYTTHNPVEFDRSGTFFLYRISYLYYTMVGMIVSVLVGVTVSYFTQPNDPSMVHRDLLTPLVHRWLPEQHPQCRHPRLSHDVELHVRDPGLTTPHVNLPKSTTNSHGCALNNNQDINNAT